MDETIKVSGLSKSYAGNKVISNIELSIGTGQVFGLLGANGAGKTTTIECILGTRKADAGSVSILGLDPRKDRKQLFEQVGVQFQEASYSDKIKVWELCEETACLYQKAANYEELLRQFGLWEKRGAFVNELSGGQKQRCACARAIINHPKLLLADEPTGALDSRAADELMRLFESVNAEGQTIVMVTHSLRAASRARRVLFIKDGEVFHQLYRASLSTEEFYQRISDALTLITTGGAQNA